MFHAPGDARSAAATYLALPGRTERGPWLITRPDLAPDATAQASPSTPGPVIAALAVTDTAA